MTERERELAENVGAVPHARTRTERNMYGCTPCPKCGGVHRYPFTEKSGAKVIECGDCGRRGPWDGTGGDDGFSVDEVAP